MLLATSAGRILPLTLEHPTDSDIYPLYINKSFKTCQTVKSIALFLI